MEDSSYKEEDFFIIFIYWIYKVSYLFVLNYYFYLL